MRLIDSGLLVASLLLAAQWRTSLVAIRHPSMNSADPSGFAGSPPHGSPPSSVSRPPAPARRDRPPGWTPSKSFTPTGKTLWPPGHVSTSPVPSSLSTSSPASTTPPPRSVSSKILLETPPPSSPTPPSVGSPCLKPAPPPSQASNQPRAAVGRNVSWLLVLFGGGLRGRMMTLQTRARGNLPTEEFNGSRNLDGHVWSVGLEGRN